MKIYDTRRSNGRLLPFKVRDQHVWYTTGNMPYPDALAKIQKTANRFKHGDLQSVFSVDYSRGRSIGKNYKRYNLREDNTRPNTLVKDKGTFYIQTQKASNKHFPPKPKSPYWRPLDYNSRGRCVIIDDGRKQSSPYGYTYDDLSMMLKNNDYHEYIQDGDYLKLTVGDYVYTMRFNIDTYYDYAIVNPFKNSIYIPEGSIPHHIDMLSDEVYAEPTNFSHGYFSDEMVREYIDRRYKTDTSNRLRIRTTVEEANDSVYTNFFQFVDNKFYTSVERQLGDMLKKHIHPKLGKGYNMDMMYTPNSADIFPKFHKVSSMHTDIRHGNLWQLSEVEIFGYTAHGFPEDVSADIQYPTCRIYGSQKTFPVRKDLLKTKNMDQYRLYTTTTMSANLARNDYDNKTVIVAGTGVSYSKNVPEMTDGIFGKDVHYTLNFRFI